MPLARHVEVRLAMSIAPRPTSAGRYLCQADDEDHAVSLDDILHISKRLQLEDHIGHKVNVMNAGFITFKHLGPTTKLQKKDQDMYGALGRTLS